MNVSPDEYIKIRLDDQIEWYCRKSSQNQRMFKRLQLITVISSSSIPFLISYASEYSIIEFLVGVIGVAVAAITAVSGLYKYQENWLSYRNTGEMLKHQKFLYITGTDPYEGEFAFKQLVQNVEMIISTENNTWSNQMEKIQDRKIADLPLANI